MTTTKDQKAQLYAEKKIQETIPECYQHDEQIYDADDIKNAYKQAYEDGHTACEQSMWRSVEEELPEEKKVVLCFMPDMKDNYAENDSYFDMAILLEGEFINLDAETIHPTHWMQIPIPSLPDTNTENP